MVIFQYAIIFLLLFTKMPHIECGVSWQVRKYDVARIFYVFFFLPIDIYMMYPPKYHFRHLSLQGYNYFRTMGRQLLRPDGGTYEIFQSSFISSECHFTISNFVIRIFMGEFHSCRVSIRIDRYG